MMYRRIPQYRDKSPEEDAVGSADALAIGCSVMLLAVGILIGFLLVWALH